MRVIETARPASIKNGGKKMKKVMIVLAVLIPIVGIALLICANTIHLDDETL